jgi:hypothetical protein
MVDHAFLLRVMDRIDSMQIIMNPGRRYGMALSINDKNGNLSRIINVNEGDSHKANACFKLGEFKYSGEKKLFTFIYSENDTLPDPVDFGETEHEIDSALNRIFDVALKIHQGRIRK